MAKPKPTEPTPEAPKPPFAVGQAVRPKKELLEKYPVWAKNHDKEAKVARIRPSYNNQKVLQGWDVHLQFEVGPKWLVSEADIDDVLPSGHTSEVK